MIIYNISDRDQYVSDQWITPGESIEVEENYGTMCTRDLPHVFARKAKDTPETSEETPTENTQEEEVEIEAEPVEEQEEVEEDIQEVPAEESEEVQAEVPAEAQKPKKNTKRK